MAALPLAAANAGLNIVGGIVQGLGKKEALEAARKQIEAGMAENTQLSDQFRGEQAGFQQPWMAGGQKAFSDLQSFRMRQPEDYQANKFGGVDINQDPGVQYRMDQAIKALDASAANKGMLFSGAQQKALQENAQNLASQEFGNAYGRQYGQFSDEENARRDQSNLEANRNMSLDQFRMSQLQGIAGQGQAATGQLANAYQNIGSTQLANQVNMRGAMADNRGARAAVPYNIAGSAMAGAGNAARDMSSYFMNR